MSAMQSILHDGYLRNHPFVFNPKTLIRANHPMFEISPTIRIRRSPFYEATVADGVTGFMPYNQMLMPAGYGNPEAELLAFDK